MTNTRLSDYNARKRGGGEMVANPTPVFFVYFIASNYWQNFFLDRSSDKLSLLGIESVPVAAQAWKYRVALINAHSAAS